LTLAGATHAMYPRGSNRAAQGAIDGHTLADCLASHGGPRNMRKKYEVRQLAMAKKVVLTNREYPRGFINIKVDELMDDRYITQDELRAVGVVGFALGCGVGLPFTADCASHPRCAFSTTSP